MKAFDVYEKLKDDIVNLVLEPGDTLQEIETSKKFNTSRTPIRDVFKRLEQLGLLNIVSHVGTFVAPINMRRISDTLFVREKIEMSILRRLVDKPISDSKVKRLREEIVKQEELLALFNNGELEDKEFAKTFLDLDDVFHKLLFESAYKSGVWTYLFDNELEYRRFRVFLNMLPNNNISNLIEQHKMIIKLILEKDKDSLKEVMYVHINNGILRISESGFDNSKYFSSK